MKTQIKKHGNSTVIILSPDFMKFHDAKIGDWIDMSDVMIIKKKGKRTL